MPCCPTAQPPAPSGSWLVRAALRCGVLGPWVAPLTAATALRAPSSTRALLRRRRTTLCRTRQRQRRLNCISKHLQPEISGLPHDRTSTGSHAYFGVRMVTSGFGMRAEEDLLRVARRVCWFGGSAPVELSEL